MTRPRSYTSLTTKPPRITSVRMSASNYALYLIEHGQPELHVGDVVKNDQQGWKLAVANESKQVFAESTKECCFSRMKWFLGLQDTL